MATETTPVTGVDFVAIPVTDYDAAAEFYGGVLACPSSSAGATCQPASSRPAT